MLRISEVETAAWSPIKPFPFIVLDDFLPPQWADEAEMEFPKPDNDHWVRYNGPFERKLACNALNALHPIYHQILITELGGPFFMHWLGGMMKMEGLQSDPTLWGGGLHMIERGGKLDLHLDKSRHPHTGLERRLNLIVFLNREWQDDWGGDLELWEAGNDGQPKSLHAKIQPIFNRAVIFETSDVSYHGHPHPLNCPEGVFRKSMALYYFVQPTGNQAIRPRAKFVAHPNDPPNPELERLRLERAGLVK